MRLRLRGSSQRLLGFLVLDLYLFVRRPSNTTLDSAGDIRTQASALSNAKFDQIRILWKQRR